MRAHAALKAERRERDAEGRAGAFESMLLPTRTMLVCRFDEASAMCELTRSPPTRDRTSSTASRSVAVLVLYTLAMCSNESEPSSTSS